MPLPPPATGPAGDARRYETAQRAGQVIVGLVRDDLRPSAIMTRAAFENAIRVNAAIGGSTNAVIHLLAIAGRLGVPLALDDFDALARDVPTLVILQPSGQYLMEDFCYAGGLPAVMRELAENGLLHADAITVTGSAVGANVADAPCWNREVVKTVADPFQPAGTATAVLHGNLAPGGAVIKQSASSPQLLKHRGRRPARAGADRRLDHPGRAGQGADAGGQRRGAGRPPGAVATSRGARQPGLDLPVHRARAAGRRRS